MQATLNYLTSRPTELTIDDALEFAKLCPTESLEYKFGMSLRSIREQINDIVRQIGI